MATFAETQKVYADGQRAVESFPQEMAFYGFVPPLRTPTGDLTTGDVLTAQWVNSIFRDCFRAQKQLTTLTLPNDFLTAGSALDIQIGALRLVAFTANAAGETTYPAGATFKEPPIVLAFNNSSASAAANPVVVTSATVDKWRARGRSQNGAGATEINAGLITLVAIGEHTGTVPPAPEHAMFAEFEKTYADGQTSWTAPSADQWSTGFVPTYTAASGAVIPGDQLAANALNFILCDLFRKGGRGVVANGGYVLQAGPLKFQFWRANVLAGGDRLPFPEPFRKGAAPFISGVYNPEAGATAGEFYGVSVGPNTQDPGNIHSWSGPVRVWNSETAPVSVDGSVTMMAVGFGDRQVSLQRYYTSFAATAKTYPDQQSNTKTIPADVLASGFKPPVRNADGSFSKSDTVDAQSINTLFKMAYADATATLTPLGGQFVETTGQWQGVENSKYWIAWSVRAAIPAADWSTGLKIAPPYPIKAGTKMIGFASDTANTDHALVSLSTESTNTQAVFRAHKYAAPGTNATPAQIRVLLMGVKP